MYENLDEKNPNILLDLIECFYLYYREIEDKKEQEAYLMRALSIVNDDASIDRSQLLWILSTTAMFYRQHKDL